MGMDNMGGGRPPMPPSGPAGAPPAMGGPGGAGAMPDLQALWESLPPEYQSKLDPKNPITALHFNRLRNLRDEEGEALLMFMSKATAPEIAAFKKAFPELDLLLDIFDDGEINNSVGGDGAESDGMDDGGLPPGRGAGMPVRPPPGNGSPYEEEDEEDLRPGARLNSIMA